MAHLRLVTEHDFCLLPVDTLQLQYFEFTTFIGCLLDSNLVLDLKNKKEGKNVADHVESVSELLKDLYFFTPQAAFQRYRIPLSHSQWYNYTPYKFRVACKRCRNIIDFDLWTYKEYKQEWADFGLTTEDDGRYNPYLYLKKISVTKPTNIPWCPDCTKEYLPYLARNYAMSQIDAKVKHPKEILDKNREDCKIMNLLELGEDDLFLLKIYLHEAKKLCALSFDNTMVYSANAFTVSEEKEDPDYLEMLQLTQNLWDLGFLKATGVVGDDKTIGDVNFELNSDKYTFNHIINEKASVDAKYFWDELKSNVWKTLNGKLKTIGLKNTAGLTKSMEKMFSLVPYKYFNISIEYVLNNQARDINDGTLTLKQAQQKLPSYLLNYAKSLFRKNTKVKKSQIPLKMSERHMIHHVMGVPEMIFEKEPFDAITRLYS